MMMQLDAITGNKKATTPLEPKPALDHGRSTSMASDGEVASSPVSEGPPKASLSSAAPTVGTPKAKIIGGTDKEREKLLYPGRVNLTSKSAPSGRTWFVVELTSPP
jgi:hypothetical protein